jgi:hypothetical protein
MLKFCLLSLAFFCSYTSSAMIGRFPSIIRYNSDDCEEEIEFINVAPDVQYWYKKSPCYKEFGGYTDNGGRIEVKDGSQGPEGVYIPHPNLKRTNSQLHLTKKLAEEYLKEAKRHFSK